MLNNSQLGCNCTTSQLCATKARQLNLLHQQPACAATGTASCCLTTVNSNSVCYQAFVERGCQLLAVQVSAAEHHCCNCTHQLLVLLLPGGGGGAEPYYTHQLLSQSLRMPQFVTRQSLKASMSSLLPRFLPMNTTAVTVPIICCLATASVCDQARVEGVCQLLAV